VAALTDCLQQLHDDPALRHRLAECGYQRVLKRFSATALAKQFHQFCVDLLS
jgi:glycosyltransferase involved in cell wall biosynthesis